MQRRRGVGFGPGCEMCPLAYSQRAERVPGFGQDAGATAANSCWSDCAGVLLPGAIRAGNILCSKEHLLELL